MRLTYLAIYKYLYTWERGGQGGNFTMKRKALLLVCQESDNIHECHVKGKLAHHFMTSYLVFLSCVLGVVKALVEDNNGNINIICAYRERKILFWDH